jgi:hypothetical protein
LFLELFARHPKQFEAKTPAVKTYDQHSNEMASRVYLIKITNNSSSGKTPWFPKMFPRKAIL